MIGRNGERRSGISAQAARHDDDDVYVCFYENIHISTHIFVYKSTSMPTNTDEFSNLKFQQYFFLYERTSVILVLSSLPELDTKGTS